MFNAKNKMESSEEKILSHMIEELREQSTAATLIWYLHLYSSKANLDLLR